MHFKANFELQYPEVQIIKNCKNYIIKFFNLLQDESNKIPHEYIFSLIYTSKIKFKFLSLKVKKLKMGKQKGM